MVPWQEKELEILVLMVIGKFLGMEGSFWLDKKTIFLVNWLSQYQEEILVTLDFTLIIQKLFQMEFKVNIF